MFDSMLDALFGCSHRRTTFPLTPARRTGFVASSGHSRKGPYVVCLDCGKEFDYNWQDMRVGRPVGVVPAPTQAESYSTANR